MPEHLGPLVHALVGALGGRIRPWHLRHRRATFVECDVHLRGAF